MTRQFCFLFILLFPCWVLADFQDALKQLNQIQAHEPRRLLAIEQGQQRALLCGYCHGKDGNSVQNRIPNLAAQNAEYLLRQFYEFESGERKSYVMGNLAKILSQQERINLALYYSGQNLIASEAVSNHELFTKGQEKYQNFCFACHGEEGLGSKTMPRLAGQKQAFLQNTLKEFKRGEKSRRKSPMVRIMKAVQEDEILPLAVYISQLP